MATMTHAPSGTRHTVLVQNLGVVTVGVFLAMHGIAHSLAFFTQWQITHPKGIAYTTTLFYGKIDVGGAGIRIDGLLWLVVAAAFVVVGLRLAWLRRVEAGLIAAVTLFSLSLCVLGLTQTVVGFWIDVAVLLGLALLVIVRRRQAI